MRTIILCLLVLFSCSTYSQTTKLPVIKLTGRFGREYIDGKVTVIMPDGTSFDNMEAKIKWRGGTTNNDFKHKRNYKIKFSTEKQFFGMRSDEDWILDAGQADLFRLRNRIATDLWNDFATKPYYYNSEPKVMSGVRGEVVEVYLNDEYRGIYCFTECMDRKQMKLKKYDKQTGEIRGGLWKAVGYGYSTMWEVGPYDNKSSEWDFFEVKYPKLDDVDTTDYSTLYQAIDFVVHSTDKSFIQHVHEYFDLPVVIDYYIFVQVLSAIDNIGKNIYWAVYDKTKQKTITPAVWDLDASTGQKWTEKYLENSSSPEHNINFYFNLYDRLINTNAGNFKEKTLQRYHQLRKTYLSTENLLNRYNSFYELISNSGAAQREEERWSKDSDIDGEVLDFKAEIAYITDWITRRMNYLDQYVFPDISNVNEITIHQQQQIYNLNGQKMTNKSSLKKGVYIQGGRKYVSR